MGEVGRRAREVLLSSGRCASECMESAAYISKKCKILKKDIHIYLLYIVSFKPKTGLEENWYVCIQGNLY